MNSTRNISYNGYTSNALALLCMAILMLGALPARSIGLITPVHLLQAMAEEKNDLSSTPQPSSDPAENSNDMTKGYWHSQQTRDKYCIKFSNNYEQDQTWGWRMSRCFDKTAFEKKQTDVFQLRREAGTLTLRGKLDDPESEGTYEFTEDNLFRKYLSDNNISSTDENWIFHLYLSDINKSYIEFLKKHYPQIHGDRLMELAIHGVSQKQYIAYLNLFEKYSQKKPSMQEVIEAKIHGIDQEYVEMLQASGYQNVSLKKMMEAKIHGIDTAFIAMLRKEGFTDLSMNQILEAKIHGINSALLKQVQALGYANLSLQKIIETKIHGVNAAYIQELTEAGFANLPINKLIEAKVHGVDAQFIHDAKNKGYQLENIGQYIELKIHGLSRSHLRN